MNLYCFTQISNSIAHHFGVAIIIAIDLCIWYEYHFIHIISGKIQIEILLNGNLVDFFSYSKSVVTSWKIQSNTVWVVAWAHIHALETTIVEPVDASPCCKVFELLIEQI